MLCEVVDNYVKGKQLFMDARGIRGSWKPRTRYIVWDCVCSEIFQVDFLLEVVFMGI